MGDEQPYTTQRENSAKTSSHSTNPPQLAYASQRAEVLFGCYRRGDANDPKRYVTSIAAVLSLYDADLIREVTDPRTGIMTTKEHASFMPNAGELKIYCDAIAERRERLKRLGAIPKPDFSRPTLAPPPARPGDKANVFVPNSNMHYPKLVEWSKTADPVMFRFGKNTAGDSDGIWVNWDIWDRRQSATRPKARADDPKPLQLSPEAQKVLREQDELRKAIMPPAEDTAA